MKSPKPLLPKTLLIASIGSLFFSGIANAVIVESASWALGETGSVSGTGHETPLVDSIGGHNITGFQAGGSPVTTIVTPSTVGMPALGSTAALQLVSTGNAGWNGNALPMNLSSDWGFEIYVNTVSGTSGTLMETDNSTTGVSLVVSGGNLSFGTGSGGASNLIGSTAYSSSTWYKVDIIRFGTTNYYFIDNILVATASSSVGTFLNAPMLGFGQNGTNQFVGTSQYDQMSAWTFNSAGGDTLPQVESAMAVPEPSACGFICSGLLALASSVRRRQSCI